MFQKRTSVSPGVPEKVRVSDRMKASGVREGATLVATCAGVRRLSSEMPLKAPERANDHHRRVNGRSIAGFRNQQSMNAATKIAEYRPGSTASPKTRS